ncbi:hypothetical protein D915_010827 [Fasciola hepatica]|uniref:CUB domain-containing protein n=1 Tax=Fasciola hepatica TaxID=6192 RepID=A0A4E0QVY1_FASHE|nr:hypothetical protein D915_010827 [Fasciola hepatica]
MFIVTHLISLLVFISSDNVITVQQVAAMSPIVPQCLYGNINATVTRTTYLAYADPESGVCSWFITSPEGKKITLETEPPEKPNGTCVFRVSESSDTYLDCNQKRTHTSENNQIVVSYNNTNQNITFHVVIASDAAISTSTTSTETVTTTSTGSQEQTTISTASTPTTPTEKETVTNKGSKEMTTISRVTSTAVPLAMRCGYIILAMVLVHSVYMH